MFLQPPIFPQQSSVSVLQNGQHIVRDRESRHRARGRLVRACTVTMSGRWRTFPQRLGQAQMSGFVFTPPSFFYSKRGSAGPADSGRIAAQLNAPQSASRFTGLEGFVVISVQRTTQEASFSSWPRALWSSGAVAKAESISPGISWEGWCSLLSSRKIMLL